MSLALMARVAELERKVETLATAIEQIAQGSITLGEATQTMIEDHDARIVALEGKKKART